MRVEGEALEKLAKTTNVTTKDTKEHKGKTVSFVSVSKALPLSCFMSDSQVKIIGAGLAGCEAAWQCARRGIEVELYEMRPQRSTPAHQTADFAELVCSNSLKSNSEFTAPWLLKEEMRRADSLLMEIARDTAVPAGHALAVDRAVFAAQVTEAVSHHPHIKVDSRGSH